MTTKNDGGAADFLSDEVCQHICQMIAKGYRSGGYPMRDGKMMGWAEWLRSTVADAMLAQRKAEG